MLKWLILLIPLSFMGLNFYFWGTLGRQNESRQTTSLEVLNASWRALLPETREIVIVGRNLGLYFSQEVNPLIRRLLRGHVLQRLDFVVGPDRHEEELVQLLELRREFPDKVNVYLEETGIESGRQFILTDTTLHVQNDPFPLSEPTRGVLIEKPNRFMRKRYLNKISELRSSCEVAV